MATFSTIHTLNIVHSFSFEWSFLCLKRKHMSHKKRACMLHIFILIWNILRHHVYLSRESDATVVHSREKRYAPEDLALLSRVYAGLEWMLLRAKPKCPRSECVNAYAAHGHKQIIHLAFITAGRSLDL